VLNDLSHSQNCEISQQLPLYLNCELDHVRSIIHSWGGMYSVLIFSSEVPVGVIALIYGVMAKASCLRFQPPDFTIGPDSRSSGVWPAWRCMFTRCTT
jgi:hypothetical protein